MNTSSTKLMSVSQRQSLRCFSKTFVSL